MKKLSGIIAKEHFPDIRRLFINFFSLSGVQVVNYIFPLITIPYLARVLGVENLGKIAFAAAIIGYCNTVVSYGFDYSATRDIAKSRENKEIIIEIFSSVMWARIVLLFISFFILLLLALTISVFRSEILLILVSFLSVVGHTFFPEWLFQGLERMSCIAILNMLAKVVFTGAVFIFIKNPEDYWMQPLFLGGGFLVSGVISILYARYMCGIYMRTVSVRKIFETLRSGFDLFVNILIPNLYNSASIIFLGIVSPDKTANGIFDAGQKFIGISTQFFLVVSRACFPFLVRRISFHSLYVLFNFILSVSLSVGMWVLAPFLIDIFYTGDFSDAVWVLRCLSIAFPFSVLFYVYGTGYLVVIKKDRLLRNISVCVSLVAALIAFPLVYSFSYMGVAFTLVFARISIGLSVAVAGIYFKKLKNREN